MEHIELPSLLGNDLLRGPRHSPCFDPLPPERKWEVQRPGALTVIPHFSTDGCSYCHFRSGDRWDRRQTVDVLVDGGVSVPELAEAYTAEMAKLDGGDEVRATASDALVFQLWVTAVASGLVLRQRHGLGAEALDRALRDRDASRAWSTLTRGALRKTFPPEAGARLGDFLAPLVERAVLSGGQWQKVALARGFMPEHPLLLVLDEPTSALDPLAERELFERYAGRASEVARRRGGITLFVTHRFSTVRIADLILVVSEGAVAEAGSHRELLEADGRYARLHRLQSEKYR